MSGDRVFDALADPRRRAILRAVADGESTATELARSMPVSRQAVRKHLDRLAAAGLVAPHPSGREVRWRFQPDVLDEASAWIDEVERRWDRRVRALEERLSDDG